MTSGPPFPTVPLTACFVTDPVTFIPDRSTLPERLSGAGAACAYTVLATDLDGAAAAATAEAVGGFSMQLDVRDPEAHRRAARAAIERGPLEVWVNNAGVLRTRKVWEQPDDEIRLIAEINMLGVIWGSRAGETAPE